MDLPSPRIAFIILTAVCAENENHEQMSAAPESGPPTPRAVRPGAGLLLSIGLHLVALGVFVSVRWPQAEAAAPRPREAVVWLAELPQAAVEPPIDASPELIVHSAAPAPDAGAPPVEPRPARKAERPRARAAPVPRAAQSEERAAVPAPEQPSGPRAIDWEKERRAAVASLIAELESPRHYVTFSADDYSGEPPAPIEPVPPPFIDDCVIAHGRLQVFMAQMMGRCVRDARGDLFAAIMPEYLTTRPVCRETHPASPGSVLADGTEISTVKCELVARAERR